MQALQSFFSGPSAPDKEPPASVLSEWNKYATTTGSAAQAPAGGSQTDRLLASAEEGAASVSTFFSGAFASVSTGVSGAASSVTGGLSSMPSTTQWTYFAAFFGAGMLFLLLSVLVFLPIIILAPTKFALTFSMGSGLIVASLGALKGWKQMLGHLVSKERLPSTAAYLGSLVGTMYAALILHSYLFSLLFCGAQVLTLLYFVASYFPGGSAGANYAFGAMGRGALSMGGGLARSVFGS